MYTLECAALVLGISSMTLERWIARAGIKKVIIYTDRARAYITHEDVIMLSDKNTRRLGTLDKIINKDGKIDFKDFYTMEEIAKFIGVSVDTVRRWLRESTIEKKYIVTGRKRVYISYHDVLRLVITNARQVHREDAIIEDKVDNTSKKSLIGTNNDLYTIKDVACIIGVKTTTVMYWIKKFNISKTYIYTNKERVYIHHSDVLMLACHHSISTSPEERHKQGLYTIKETALFIGVSESKVRELLKKLNIIRIRIDTDKKTTYIHYSDVLVLARRHQKT
jgi:excisionase family DNA binding protein